MSNLNALWRVERKGDRRAPRDLAPQFMTGVKGHACLRPYPYDAQGERHFRDCGHCAKCWGAKKRDNTGRSMAEAENSPDMVFFTLTIADVRVGSYAKSPLHAEAIQRARDHMFKLARKLGHAPDAKDDAILIDEQGIPWPSIDPMDFDERLRPYLFFDQTHPAAKDFRVKDRQDFLMQVRNTVIADTKRMLGVPARMLRIEPGETPTGKPKPVFQAAHEIDYWRHMMKTHTPRVRFVSMGEKGDQRNRCHFHVLCFFDKPLFRGSPATKDRPALAPSILLRSTPDATDWMGRVIPGDENHPLWPLGYTQAKVCGPSVEERLRFVRYLISYMDQTTVTKRDRLTRKPRNAVYARSTKPALGYKYIIERAEEAGRQGVRYDGWFQVAGVKFSHGSLEMGPDGQPRFRAADHFKNFLRGVLRKQAADAFAASYEKHHPNGTVPLSDFMIRFWDHVSIDPMKADDQRRTAGNKEHPPMWRKRSDMPAPQPAIKRTAKAGYFVVKVGGKEYGTLKMDRTGFVIFADMVGGLHPVPHGNLRDILRHASHDVHLDIETWIKDQRGSGWVSDREFRANRHKAQLDQREALLRLAAFAPDPNPAYLGIDGPRGALSRKLAMHGDAHIPGTVVRHGWSDTQYQRGETKLRKPIKDRDP